MRMIVEMENVWNTSVERMCKCLQDICAKIVERARKTGFMLKQMPVSEPHQTKTRGEHDEVCAKDRKDDGPGKVSGQEMIAAPFLHADESLWVSIVAYLSWRGMYLPLTFMLLEPLLAYTLCRALSKPGDPQHARNNIILVDLRWELNTFPQISDLLKGDASKLGDIANSDEQIQAKMFSERPNSEWVRMFQTSLAPDTVQNLSPAQRAYMCVLSQGEKYLPKASGYTLAMVFFASAFSALSFSRLTILDALKVTAIVGAHTNLIHILRDHSVSGLTHHAAHNIGEYDKWEFIFHDFKRGLARLFLSYVLRDVPYVGHFLKVANALLAVKFLGFSNHTLVHYTRLDIKGKGVLWRFMLDLQGFLAACKVVASKQYHAQHHFHNEMSYPAILMPINEYLNAKSLTPLLTRRLDEKSLAKIDKFLHYIMVAFALIAVQHDGAGFGMQLLDIHNLWPKFSKN